MPTPPDPWLTVQGAADLLNVSPKTIRRRLADGSIPAMRLGRLIRINPADLAGAGSPVQYIGGTA
ncbi:helix-turn-helix domain-containing protein [Agrococcus baldri]|uniref:Helix-turn-helix domain-containing protein n=1 Tax=Agrococcus baldri TaxID=153730 RepID=A0AA87RHD0_9MICO|nr:helix-turn-helix domain-containing protein [Agrococcus baldri]GEK80574.1 hypothetical protein ABA31_19250 [Agrococcus baldri]